MVTIAHMHASLMSSTLPLALVTKKKWTASVFQHKKNGELRLWVQLLQPIIFLTGVDCCMCALSEIGQLGRGSAVRANQIEDDTPRAPILEPP